MSENKKMIFISNLTTLSIVIRAWFICGKMPSLSAMEIVDVLALLEVKAIIFLSTS